MPFFLVLGTSSRPGAEPRKKLDLLACKRAPAAARAMIHPGNFQPRKNIVGWAQDLGLKQLMWQDRGSGTCTWQVPRVFWQE